MENTRTEKLKDSIEDTEQEIKNIQIVIQGLENLKKDTSSLEIREELSNLLNSFDSKIKYLEDIKDNEEKTLNLFY